MDLVLEERTPAQKSCIKNISTIGAFIETTLLLDVDDEVVFQLSSTRTIIAVVRRRQMKMPRGVGVEFLRAITPEASEENQASEG